MRSRIPIVAALLAGVVLGQPRDSDQQTIATVREYALNYTKRLLSYTCILTTRHVTRPANAGNPIPPEMTDIEEQFSFVNGKELRTITRIDGHAVPEGTTSPLTEASSGEFGNMLNAIFQPSTQTEFRLDRPTKLNDRKVDVLTFHVPQAKGYTLNGSKGSLRVPFEGSVYADAETHEVLKIQLKTTKVPPNFEIRNHSLILEYKSTRIGGKDFILPSRFVLEYYDGPDDRIHTNEGRYSGYHLFSANSEIHFEDNEAADETHK